MPRHAAGPCEQRESVLRAKPVPEPDDLPQAARDYVQFIQDFTGVHVSFVGVGPARDQTIVQPRAA